MKILILLAWLVIYVFIGGLLDSFDAGRSLVMFVGGCAGIILMIIFDCIGER
jgi:hypothetical protein